MTCSTIAAAGTGDGPGNVVLRQSLSDCLRLTIEESAWNRQEVMRIVIYASSHGFGHATRDIELVNAIVRKAA